ncbi:hypothetical protein FEM33_24025 [Dyadobacter flavalbus]|uniref:DUF3592 domain-containing protein n=2 Tax=Dyadobacter flavalbus TaxID=2579942 RepID=A0A5M8QCR2_9BACT|nr:hypothetical protein FEM33_24025 [Dyadobacter flavalbus]
MVVFWIVSSLRKKIHEERKRRILKEGVQAKAKVLHIQPTGEYLNNLPEFHVQVQIQPENGADFVAEVTEAFPYPKYDSLRNGSHVVVKYDPDYYKRVIFVQMDHVT